MRASMIALVICAAALSASCGLFRPDQSCHKTQDYESSGSIARLKVPAGLDVPDTRDALVVPPMDAPEAPRSQSDGCLDEPPRYRSDHAAQADAQSESQKDTMAGAAATGAPDLAVNSSNRGAGWEYGLDVVYLGAADWSFEGGSSVSVSDDTALTLFGKMEDAASRLLADLLPRIARGEIPRRPNDLARGSYFSGRRPEDGRIDWSRPAVEIYNLVRAVTRPYPGAFTELAGEKLTVWWAIPLPAQAGSVPSPGTIRVSGGPSYAMAGGCVAPVSGPRRVVVETGKGWLQLEEIEWKTRTAKGEVIVDLLAGAANGRFS